MASSKETSPTFALPSECLSFLFFPSSGIGKKRLFNKAFNIDYWPLADNHVEKDVDLSFAECQCPSAVKANRPWQRKLLDQKLICIVEAIPLAVAIFWDPSFILCSWYISNLAKKLDLKTKNLKNNIVKEYIQKIWANRIIAQLHELFKSNLDWWSSIAIIFSQPLLKTGKK